MTFDQLNIIKPILDALNEKGYSTPTPIQNKSIPKILNKNDVLGLAQTGTGKTAAFLLPIIQQIFLDKGTNEKSKIKALILVPTRELATQISDCFNDYNKYTRLKHCVIFGGVKQDGQIKKLKENIDIIIATPGRLLDLIDQRFIDLNFIQHFIIDEADRMLDMGFIHDLKKIILKLPQKRQTLLFSATMPSMISNLSKTILKNPVKIEVTPVSSTAETIQQYIYFVEKKEKNDLLINLLLKNNSQSVLVFSRTKHGADKIVRVLGKAGITSEAIHGNKSQNARQRTLKNFMTHKNKVLIATDIASRGIDVDQLELVINYDLPNEAETYVHRIGRTGRAGNTGTALTFCSQDEQNILKNIQKLTGKKIVEASSVF